MGQQSPKKTWVSPELIVLVRSKPEEAVLGGCKGAQDGPTGADDFCMDPTPLCSECSTSAAS